jgi:phage terminase large subunit-like protein
MRNNRFDVRQENNTNWQKFIIIFLLGIFFKEGEKSNAK